MPIIVKKIGVLLLTVLLSVVFVFGAMAAETKMSGKAYIQYTTGDNASGFDVGRAYVTLKSKINNKIKARITTDIKRLSSVGESGPLTGGSVAGNSIGGYYMVFLKYAYLEIAEVLPGAKLIFGQHGLPWVGFSEKVWGYRYVAKSFSDEEGELTSADLGIGLKGKLLGGNLEYAASLVNGEGYHMPESNLNSDTEARLTFKGFPGVELSVGCRYRPGSSARSRLMALASHKDEFFSLAGEYLSGDDAGVASNGIAIYGTLRLIKDVSLFGRYSAYDPETAIAGGSHNTTLIGLQKKLAKEVSLAFDYKALNPDTGSSKTKSTSYAVHVEVKY